jgi:CoA:oxalate CoA-transferase
MSLPLEGIRVIDFSQIYAGPYCTMQLAAMGADIIKVEPPGAGENLRRPHISRGGVSYRFLLLNANKRSITINLKDARGRELALRLIETADVLVENYLEGVMKSFGLAYEQIAERFPRLIYASAKGYGADSRWAYLGSMDTTIQASSGMIDITGFPEEGIRTPATFIDMGTGSHLVSGILAALIHRGRTGKGQKVNVAMLDVAIPALSSSIGPLLEGHQVLRTGNRYLGACPINIYPALDGKVFIFSVTEPHWRAIAKLIGREDLLSDPRCRNSATRYEIADEIDGLIASWTKDRRRDEVIEALIEAGVPCAPVRSIAEVVADPEVERHGMLVPSDYPTRGPIKVGGSPIKLSAAPAAQPRRPPMLGEHSEEILKSVGLDAEEIERLRKDGVI